MTTTYKIVEPPADRLVYTMAEAGEVLGISGAFAYELVARSELVCAVPLLRRCRSSRLK